VWRQGTIIDEDFAFAKISGYLRRPDLLTWVDLCEPDHARLWELASEVNLEPLAVEDAVAQAERAKATRYPTHTFMTVYAVGLAPPHNRPTISSRFEISRVSAFILAHGLITVRSTTGFDIDDVVRRWDEEPGLISYGVNALVHGLLDTVADGHFAAVQDLDDAMEELEDELFDDHAPAAQLQRVAYRVRKDLVELRRAVLPMREVINAVLRQSQDTDAPAELDPWYDDLYDHVLRATEWTESLRDMITAIFETTLSLQDARLNNVMKKLTGWAAIIAVPTAVTGYFGQNVPYPGSGTQSGFIASVAVILGIGLTLFTVFKRKNWI
jgi:magnesium transporter